MQEHHTFLTREECFQRNSSVFGMEWVFEWMFFTDISMSSVGHLSRSMG